MEVGPGRPSEVGPGRPCSSACVSRLHRPGGLERSLPPTRRTRGSHPGAPKPRVPVTPGWRSSGWSASARRAGRCRERSPLSRTEAAGEADAFCSQDLGNDSPSGRGTRTAEPSAGPRGAGTMAAYHGRAVTRGEGARHPRERPRALCPGGRFISIPGPRAS